MRCEISEAARHVGKVSGGGGTSQAEQVVCGDPVSLPDRVLSEVCYSLASLVHCLTHSL